MKINFHILNGEKPMARYGFCDTPVGKCLIAETELGVCWLSFVTGSEREAERKLERFWPKEKLKSDVESIKLLAKRLFLTENSNRESIDVLVCGTAFQLIL
ncbi:MAG: hypothetical protein LUD68_05785 [Rikenellaceae bacterium]|nr:hypothetical protein [Rikenellaceae bacterium]